MFTGLVEEMGKVRELKTVENDGVEMTIECSLVLEGVQLGDSIAINGTCLTVIKFDTESFSVGLAPETLRKTSLGEVQFGSSVNLERSVTPSTRMGGHFVQGHVDGTGTIVSFEPENDSLWVKIKTSPELLKYIVPKGYIAVDGTSLTVVKIFWGSMWRDCFRVTEGLKQARFCQDESHETLESSCHQLLLRLQYRSL
ncbi:hypothetical protein R1flu_012118 [Riccia fluitans]|uniref:Lumazine-binding domain-containing protein n=1 Tax=Riccia fluitans TaxID=41844 RepID=A0ABD1Z9R5_9MARC